MKTLKSYYWTVLIVLLMVAGCSDSGSTGPDPDPGQTEASDVKQFVYNAMNDWYLWQKDAPNLADDRFEDDAAKQQFLTSYADAETLFDDLQVEQDKYSFFIEDYEKYEQENNGIYAAYGFDYGYFWKSAQQQELIGFFRYIVPGSPADEANLKRLQLFTKVNGNVITANNYQSLLRSNSSQELTLAHIEVSNNSLSYVEDSTVTVDSRQVEEDPIHYTSVIDTNGVKIGYMMFNAFHSNNHHHLNQVMGDFKSQGIDKLVLDLRYNGGGAVITSETLSSMISGLDDSHVFAKFMYNDKHTSSNETDHFLNKVPLENEDGDFVTQNGEYVNTEPMNKLNLDHLYVLMSSSTASASEALINSLRPFIDVTVIGTKTEGKDVGSLTLYDAAPNYTNKTNINPDHKKAIQPIVVSFVNADGQNYPDGFKAVGYDQTAAGGCPDNNSDNCVNELTLENIQNKPAVGSPEDPLLSRAIDLIIGQPKAPSAQVQSRVPSQTFKEIDTGDLYPLRNRMYIEPSMLPKSDQK